ncbi:Uncharacterized protein TPAR_06589 [Tolypocladium paradoxum]|uniref:Ubiquitin-like domain-containing protein n=1 Tax=Tolypocladium paradoxum TaxID=94208 RepID=A0A2S4KSU9_9HYPO|nr:Uncharacterized protein TPAR_06589 [Tolypocladium paradoxum]
MAHDAALSPPRKMKKLPFKPTALRRTSLPKPASGNDDAKGDDDGLALFRRSKEMAPIVAADRERRLKKKQKQEEERRRRSSAAMGKRPLEDADDAPLEDKETQHERSPLDPRQEEQAQDIFSADESMTVDGPSFSELVTPPASKRSRIESTPSKTPKQILSLEEADAFAVDSPSARVLRSHSKLATPIKSFQESMATSGSAAIIPLDSDDDDDDDGEDDVVAISTPLRRRRDTSIEVVDDSPAPLPSEDDDDEFGEYVRKAEEQRTRDQAMLRGGADGTPEKDKEKVEILVTSTVANSWPCCIKFLFDKPLRLVRDSWIALQRRKGVELSLRQDDDVILTWRRKKVYTFTTLLNLGIRPQAGGRIQVEDNSRGGLTRRNNRVHLEAWTPELFQEMEREEELRRKREAGELSEEEEALEEPPEPEIKIRVILRARGLEDVKLTVRPETTVETLVTGFRTQRGVGSDKDVGLWFDGDRLEEHVTMIDAEINDMDAFEVHIK